MVCPNCGNKLPDEPARFCGNCGADISVLYTLDQFRTPSQEDPAEVPENAAADHVEKQTDNSSRNNSASGPRKRKKRLPRILLIILAIVVLGVIIFSGVYYWLRHHSLGKLPDPEYFLGVEADYQYSSKYTVEYEFYTIQDPVDAAEAFCDLLLENSEYKVVYENCKEYNEYIEYIFGYDGWREESYVYFVKVVADYSTMEEEGYNSLKISYLGGNINDRVEIVQDETIWDGEFIRADGDDESETSGVMQDSTDNVSSGEAASGDDADSAGETEGDDSDGIVSGDLETGDGGEVSAAADSEETQSSDSASGKTLLAAALSDDESQSASTPDASDTRFQSFDAFAGTNLSYGGPSTSGNYTVYNLTGDADDYDVVKEYVELLSGGTMNLELVDYYEKTISSTFFSCALNYTGTAAVTETSSMNYVDGVTGNITIYGTIEGSKLTVSMWVPASMEATDFGWRYGGGTEDTTAAGESASAGLYLLADGTYQTSDGRLSTVLGQADIFLDGTEIISDVEYVADGTKEALKVYNFYRTESVYFTVPYHQLLTGDVYTFDDLRGDHSSKENNNWGPEGFNMGTAFAVLHNGNWRYPQYENSQIEDVTVRVMYYEEDAAAVFYCYVLLTSSPYEIEFLAAVNLAAAAEEAEAETVAADSSDSGSSTCWSCNGSGECQSCDGKGYNTLLTGGILNNKICASCVGSGKCPTCGGDGKL